MLVKSYYESLSQASPSFIHAPDEEESASLLNAILSTLDRHALQTLLLKVAENHPELRVELQIELARIKLGMAPEPQNAHSQVESQPYLISISDVRKQVHGAVYSASQACNDRYYRDDDGSAVFSELDETIDPLIEMAQLCLDGGDIRRALDVLGAITDELISGWNIMSEYEYEADDLFSRLGDVWAEALLATELSSDDRQMWSVKIDGWRHAGRYCGADSGLAHASRAAIEGWDHPPLVGKLKSDILAARHAVASPDASTERLMRIRLKTLERSGRLEDAAKLARVEGIHDKYMDLLVTLGLAREAVEYGEVAITTATSSLDLARKLHSHNELELALRVAERGLDFDDNVYSLAVWTRDASYAGGRQDIAIRTGLLAVQRYRTLEDYKRLRAITNESWPGIREEILTYLRSVDNGINDGQADILLHEGLLLDALEGVSNSYSYTLIERVVRECLPMHPAAVIPVCKAQAESIIGMAKSSRYHHAIKWLSLARDAYSGANNSAAWIAYKNELMRDNSRKSSLMPGLRSL